MNSSTTDRVLLPVSTVLSSIDAMAAILMLLATCVWFKDENQFSIRNCVEKALCAIGCIGVVILALAWTFYVVNRFLYTDNEEILWEILVAIAAVASTGISWKTFVIILSLIWWCTLRHNTRHRSEPISGTSAEPPVEEDYEYDYIVDPPLHAARVNQSERAEGPSIPLSANISYNVVI